MARGAILLHAAGDQDVQCRLPPGGESQEAVGD